MPGISDQFLEASFRGVPFLWRDMDSSGGRKIVPHEYPNRDDRFVEDLGEFPEVFAIRAVVAQGEGGIEYFAARDTLIAALKEPGPGTLIHPTLGEKSVVVGRFSFTESQSSIGRADFRMEFLVSQGIANPVPVTASEPEVEDDSEVVIKATLLDILSNFNVTALIPENVTDAIALLKGITGGMRSALSSVSTIVAQLIGFPTALGLSFASDAIAIQQQFARFLSLADTFDNDQDIHLIDAEVLGNDIITLSEQFDDVPSLPEDGITAANSLFDNAPGATDIAPVTFASAERKVINDVVRRNIRIIAYSLAARNAAKRSYANTNELDAIRINLESQFAIIENEVIEDSQIDHLKVLRNDLQIFFENVEVTVFRVVTTEVRQTSMLVLAFERYGDEAIEKSAELLELNRDIHNPAFVPAGEVDILQR